jgi:hypothetical protein
MPKGFCKLALKKKLSIQTLRILDRISNFLTIIDHACQGTAKTREVNLLLRYEPHIVTRDAYMCLKSRNLEEGNSVERCLCFTLVAFSWTSLIAYGWVGRRPNLSPVYRQLVDNFISALEEFEADRHETECLIWMSMVAIGHCRGNVLLSVRVNRLMDVLMKNYSYVRDWEKLQTTLRNFFWY